MIRRNPIVSIVLTEHSYGKTRIRLTKVTRRADRHEVRELTIEIRLEGDFSGSFTAGDNSLIIPTDTMKNVAYALAREHSVDSIEAFGLILTGHFLEHHRHVERATARLVEHPMQRIRIDGVEHPHAFAGRGLESRTCTVRQGRDGLHIESGIADLFLLKTTNSAFAGFLRDRYTTLPDATDRILATMLTADWVTVADGAEAASGFDWNEANAHVRRVLIETFAGHRSLSVQQTLHAMGAAVLGACARVERITLNMPNKHRILVDLKPFGLDNVDEVFIATDEPHGTITGTLERGASTGQ
jgi:urate oxidase